MAALAAQRGVPVYRATEKQLERSKFKLQSDMLAVGSVRFVKHALRQLGRDLPEHTPYPPIIADLLYREVWKERSLRDARALLEQGRRLFIKPAEGWKRFTGFVAEFTDDYRFNGASSSSAVWVSTPVRFVSEWRAYVARGDVLDLRFADHGGDRNVTPNTAVIHNAVARLMTGPEAPAGLVADFGVLDSGETALIEVNDGFSFGAYDGVPAEVYWEVMLSRWLQIVR
ncbi:ATP-grasp domain-containing protein [Paraburkholderia sp. SIMBA_054]|uniref:ATP-grasp domain-containing protein n=1 Tax=Paraburkholderia sp. SIMBA_054 TaxID=3085795 RepID=UPI00397D3D91